MKSVQHQVCNKLCAKVYDQVLIKVCDKVWIKLSNTVRIQVDNKVCDKVWIQVNYQVFKSGIESIIKSSSQESSIR